MHWPECCGITLQRRVLIAIGCLTFVLNPLCADLTKGLAAYKAGDFAAAQREFRLAAEAGDATAMLSLGFLYLHGEGVPVNHQEAVRWLQQAAELGLAPAQHGLALAYYEGRGVPRNTAVAANYFESAALQGLADAQYNLGVLYSRGDGVPQDWVRSKFWHEKAAAQGVTDSQLALGVMYANGQGVPRDYAEAARWFGAAAASGNARARRTLETGFGDPPPTQPALPAPPALSAPPAPNPSVSQAPRDTIPRAVTPRRNFWRTPPPPLDSVAFQQLQARAVAGEAAAQRDLALHYYQGVSVRRNLLRAYVWAKRGGLGGDSGGEAMASSIRRELDDELRAIADRMLQPPKAP